MKHINQLINSLKQTKIININLFKFTIMKQSILKLFLLLLVIVASASLDAQRFFPSVDTYIEQTNPNTVENTTNSGKLVVRKYINQERITFLEFNIGDFDEQVSKAELCLYFYAVSNSGTETVDVYEVTSGSVTNAMTWNTMNGNYTLSAEPVDSLNIPSTPYGWCRFDIKNLVNTIAATSGSDKKVKVALKARTSTLLLNFYSVEQTAFPHYRPFLVMTPAAGLNLVEKSRTTAAQDGYVYNAAVDTKYDEQRLWINYYKSGESKQYRYANLRFNVPATTLTASNRVTIKTKVYAAQSGDNIVYVVDLLGIDNLDDLVNVNNLTWNTMPTTGNYTYLRSRFFSLDDKTNETDIEWDVTDYIIAQQTAGKTYANFSLQIPELGGYVGHNIAFYARNYLSADPASTYIPQLIVYGPDTSTNINHANQGKSKLMCDGINMSITNMDHISGQIYNLQGAQVKAFNAVSSVDISSLAKGIYMVKLEDNSVFKFIR